MALGALAKGLLKREARVMGADKVAARGKKMVSNRRKRVANRRASAQQIMGGGEEGEATTVRPTTSLIPKGSAIVSYSGGSSGGGGSKGGNLESINNSLMVVASIMKSNLALDKGLHKQEEKAEEEQKRKEEEKRLETPKKDPKDKEEKVKIPGLGFLEGIMGFFVKYLWAAVIMKLVDFAANPMVMGIIKGLAKVGDFLINFSIGAIDVFASFIHWGYKLVEMMKGFVTNIFGDEGAKKFDIFMGNIKNLINAFLVWKFIGKKIFKGLVKNITRVFKFAKAIISRAFKFARNIASKVGKNLLKIPGVRNVVGRVAQVGGNLLSKGSSLLSKGAGAVTGKVGGLATKIFGKAAKFIAPALKAATPAVKGFASRIPILGPVIVAIVSLLSGESVGQALFKGVGAALGGALGTFIPIPILGTLLGETIGMFVGDMLYYTIMEKNPAKAFDMLKTALMGIFGFLTKIPILGNLIQLLQKGGNVIWKFGKWLFFDGIGWVLSKLGGAAKLLKEWMQAGMKRFVDNFPVFNLPLMKFKIFGIGININWLLGKAFGGIPWFKQWIDGEEQLMHFPDFSMFIPGLGLPFLIGHVGKSLFPGSFFEGWPSGISGGANAIKDAFTKKIDKNKEKLDKSKDKKSKVTTIPMGLGGPVGETFGGKGGSTYKEKNNDTINAVSNKASYEGGEGSSKIIPVPIPNKNSTPSSTGKATVGSAKTKSVDSNDPSLLLYAGK